MVSGFLRPTTGQVTIGSTDMTSLDPNRRPTALIFQNLALFPLMTVWENVAFGLEARGIDKKARCRRAEELLDLVALQGHADKKPTELSGGQRQRVAVARALAVELSVLLLDEPLFALDLKLRQHMRAELKEIQRKTSITFIYITHDQGEALTMSDRIAMMNRGCIEQVVATEEIYDHPATLFVATFVGEQNVFRGRIVGVDNGVVKVGMSSGTFTGLNAGVRNKGDDALVFVRPERMGLANGSAEPLNRLSAYIERRDLEGPFVNVFLRTSEDQELIMHLTNAGEAWRSLADEQQIGFQTEDALCSAPVSWPVSSLFRSYGNVMGGLFVGLVALWIVALIVLPQLNMIERAFIYEPRGGAAIQA